MTHAFFKALLFLAAGHRDPRLTGEQDIRKLAGVGKLMPLTRIGVPRRLARARRHLRRSPASSRRTRSSPPPRPRLVRLRGLRAPGSRRVPHRPLRVPPLLHRLPRRADGVRARALPPPPRQGRAALDALDGRRARRALGRSAAACSSRRSGIRSRLARAGRAADRRGDDTQEAIASAVASRSASPDRRRVGDLRREARAGAAARSRCLEQKFYWDELYELGLVPAGELVARGLHVLVERPLIAGSLSAVRGALGLGSRELGRARTGSSAPRRSRSRAASRSSPSSSWRCAMTTG